MFLLDDLTIRNNDLVVATAGRSFWILDNAAQAQNASLDTSEIHLLKPEDTYRIFRGSSDAASNGLGQNPKQGVIIDYFLPTSMDSSGLQLSVYGADGTELIKLTNKKDKSFKSWQGGPSAPAVIPAKKGFNRFVWNFQATPISGVDKVFVYGNYSGFNVPPGSYQVKLSVEDSINLSQPFTILPNPNITAAKGDYDEQLKMLLAIDNSIKQLHEDVTMMRSARTQLNTYKKLLKGDDDSSDLLAQADTILRDIRAWEEQLIQPDQKTFQDVINYNNKLNAEYMNLKSYVDSSIPSLTEGAKLRFADLSAMKTKLSDERKRITDVELENFNVMFKSLDIPALIFKE